MLNGHSICNTWYSICIRLYLIISVIQCLYEICWRCVIKRLGIHGCIVWLYLNAMVISIGAYINVFIMILRKSYWQLVEETSKYQSFVSYSDNFRQANSNQFELTNKIYKNLQTSNKER